MLTGLNPLSKLAVCLVWIVAVVLVFDARFQIAAILLGFFTLAVLNRTSPLVLLALMVPFALFGVGFLTTSLLFRKESDFALWVAGESPFSSQAFSAGMVLFLRAIACGVISLFFALTTDPGAFVRALMVYCRLPARVGYSLFAAMQLVPDFASRSAADALGARHEARPPAAPLSQSLRSGGAGGSIARLRDPPRRSHGDCHGGARIGAPRRPYRHRHAAIRAG